MIKRLFLLMLLVAGAAAGVAYFTIDRRPAINREAVFTPEHIERAKRILEANDPRKMKIGSVRTVAITAADGDLAINYLAHRYFDGSAETTFEDGRLRIRASLKTDALSVGPAASPFVNVEAVLREGPGLPVIEQVRVGQLPLPPSLAESVVRRLLENAADDSDLTALKDAIQKVEFTRDGARLTYEWREDLAESVRAALIPAEARERLKVYQTALAAAVNAGQGNVALVNLIRPVFAAANDRGATSDPVLENRAAIVVLTFYVDGRSLRSVVPEASNWPRPSRRTVVLNRRNDLAKHFIISAALSANTGGPFADAVGLYKEVSDSKGGSGFSFNDLAADRAGSALGSRAEGRASARDLQSRLSAPLRDRDIIPVTDDLPEFLQAAEFEKQFGGVGAPAYNRMMSDIEDRIASLSLYR
jgi:hypothetical protein